MLYILKVDIFITISRLLHDKNSLFLQNFQSAFLSSLLHYGGNRFKIGVHTLGKAYYMGGMLFKEELDGMWEMGSLFKFVIINGCQKITHL